MIKKQIKLSASSISALKACPQRFRLAYIAGIRPAEDTESQRMGTNWHAMHETYQQAGLKASIEDELGVLGDPEYAKIALDAAIQSCYAAYADKIPASKTPEEWAVEREILVRSFIGYHWFWSERPLEYLKSEFAFELPLLNPKVNAYMPVEDVVRVGKIDHIIRYEGAICNLERKSTSKSLDMDSDFWQRWQKDSQVSMYALAFRDMVEQGLLDQVLYGNDEQRAEGQLSLVPPCGRKESVRFGSTLLDVWHKPTSNPKDLTQAATAQFLLDGMYCGEKFEIGTPEIDLTATAQGLYRVGVDGVYTTMEPGKKAGTYAIRETPGMYGARLMQNIYERPEFYYARREIARTQAEIDKFQHELWSIYQTQRLMDDKGLWFSNESACRASFACQYIPICFNAGADSACSGNIPAGFKQRTVDLTVNGQLPEE
jgi:hypothetical protein